MIGFWALIAAGLAVQSEPNRPRYSAVLDAYKAACSDLRSYAATKRSVENLGWEPFTPAAGSAHARRVDYEKHGFSNVLSRNNYTKLVEAKPVYLFLMRAMESNKSSRENYWDGNRCDMHDPAYVEIVPATAIEKWIGRRRKEVIEAYSGMNPYASNPDSSLWNNDRDTVNYRFEPGLNRKISTTQVKFTTEKSSEAAEGIGLNIWSIDRKGGK